MHEKEILIAKDKDEFANYCIELFNNKEKFESIKMDLNS